MTLTDTGPLIALLDKHDPNHARCTTAAQTLPPGPLLTTWPCFTEAMYFLGKEGGHPAQHKLWGMRRAGKILIHPLGDPEMDRMEALMQQYRDTPMDVADASLVAVAEALSLIRIFTLDTHFHAYRIGGTRAFHVVP